MSTAWSNIAWLEMVRSVLYGDSPRTAILLFDKATSLDERNPHANLGAGIAHAECGSETSAFLAWHRGQADPSLLITTAEGAHRRGNYDAALIHFRGAASLVSQSPSEGLFLAGRVCQMLFNQWGVLSSANQRFCEDYLAGNASGLLLDGQFEFPVSWGWNSLARPSDDDAMVYASVGLDATTGIPAPSLRLTGLPTSRTTGVYQRISLAPGTQIVYTGCFRTRDIRDQDVRLLYIEWRQNDQTEGNHVAHAMDDMEWTCLERTFTLPDGSEPWVQFYPTIVHGQGTVWTDDLQVRITPGAP